MMFYSMTRCLTIVLSLALVCIPQELKEYRYILKGRVADASGRPVVNAVLALDEPLVNGARVSDMIETYASDIEGRFRIELVSANPDKERILYVVGPMPAHGQPIFDPPFNAWKSLT